MNTRTPHILRGPFFLVALSLACAAAHAQWVTEEFHLKAGWNAVFLHIDPSHASLNQLVGTDSNNPIEEIWMWIPPGPTPQVFDDPQTPAAGSTEWLRWDRFWAGASPMQRLTGNVAYLVRVRDGAADYTWRLKGKPMPPTRQWTSSGLNLIGFPVPTDPVPRWGQFLGPSRALHDHAEIYRYVGGPFSSTNPQRIFPNLFHSTPLNRTQAYWVRAEEYNRYFGPFEIDLQTPGGVHFGASTGQYRIRLRNRINETITVAAQLVASESAPATQRAVAGNLPLLLRGEQDLSDLSYGFTRLSDGPAQWTLSPAGEPGSAIEIVVGLDRATMGGTPGDFFAGILRLHDSTGILRVDLPVSAEVASTEGLWIGNAIVTEVAHYLVAYEPGADDRPAQNPDGSYTVEDVDESFGLVQRPFPLRLIVHNDAAGTARLLQRVFYGPALDGTIVIARSEASLDPTRLSDARRVSVAHLPWRADNFAWPFSGSLNGAAQISVNVPLDYNDHATNPFLHTFHPDHDNLDARFENVLPEGIESYGVRREISLRVLPPSGDFAGVTAGLSTLSGIYEETITLQGPDASSRVFRTRGGFALNQVSDITTLRD